MTLIADNHATKLAYRMARALLRPRDELQLVTVVASEEAVAYGKRLLEQYEQEPCDNVVTPVVSRHVHYLCHSSASLAISLIVQGPLHDMPATGT